MHLTHNHLDLSDSQLRARQLPMTKWKASLGTLEQGPSSVSLNVTISAAFSKANNVGSIKVNDLFWTLTLYHIFVLKNSRFGSQEALLDSKRLQFDEEKGLQSLLETGINRESV